MEDIIEKLADLEHRQWMHWSKDAAQLLEEILNALADKKFINEHTEEEFQQVIDTLWNKGMKKLVSWRKYWIAYDKLEEGIKDLDRRWAMEALDLMPIKCPIWQCGGIFTAVERVPPEGHDDRQGYPGDWQTPDLVCNNCGSIYSYQEDGKNIVEVEVR